MIIRPRANIDKKLNKNLKNEIFEKPKSCGGGSIERDETIKSEQFGIF
jgi:hypothetical protein